MDPQLFVKHILFHQRCGSHTNDLNTSQIVVLNSPRVSQQIGFFEKQLNKINFLKKCNTKAITEPPGRLLNDLDTKTSECLRFCSNILVTGPTTFHLLSSQPKTTEKHKERETFTYTQSLR